MCVLPEASLRVPVMVGLLDRALPCVKMMDDDPDGAVTVSVVGLLFGALEVILAIPAAPAAETLIDVLVFGHDPPQTSPPRRLRRPRASPSG
jgi:hypothetical protein